MISSINSYGIFAKVLEGYEETVAYCVSTWKCAIKSNIACRNRLAGRFFVLGFWATYKLSDSVRNIVDYVPFLKGVGVRILFVT